MERNNMTPNTMLLGAGNGPKPNTHESRGSLLNRRHAREFYNGIPLEGVNALVGFMENFERRYG
jgi:hypothetical protein